VVGEREHGTIARDEVNRLREKMTASAINQIIAMDEAEISQKITDLQLKAKSERDMESKEKELRAAVRQSKSHKGEYQLR